MNLYKLVETHGFDMDLEKTYIFSTLEKAREGREKVLNSRLNKLAKAVKEYDTNLLGQYAVYWTIKILPCNVDEIDDDSYGNTIDFNEYTIIVKNNKNGSEKVLTEEGCSYKNKISRFDIVKAQASFKDNCTLSVYIC